MKQRFRNKLASMSRTVPIFKGKTRLARAVDRVLRPQRQPLRAESLGASFVVEGHDIIEFAILWHGAYGRTVIQCLLNEAASQQRTCFWDVGANIGAVCLPLALNQPDLQVHAFEPSPTALARLGANRKANGALANLHAYAVALSNTETLVPFFEGHTETCSGIGGMYSTTHNRDPIGTLVQSAMGDNLIEAGTVPQPDLIKIDVEGWELEVLQGIPKLLASDAPLSILWEHCLYRIDERRQPHDVILSILEKHNFEIFACKGKGELVPFERSMLEKDHDFLARRLKG